MSGYKEGKLQEDLRSGRCAQGLEAMDEFVEGFDLKGFMLEEVGAELFNAGFVFVQI